MNKALTIAEAAELLGLAPKTLYKYTENGIIPSVKYGTSRRAAVRLDYDDVMKFKAKHRREACRR